jgi:hypothetical protein
MNEHLPDDCDECTASDGSGFHHMFGYVAENYPNASLGLISSLEDATIRTFWGYGLNDCNVLLPSYTGAMYTEGLNDLRDYFDEVGLGGTFYFAGTDHTKIATSAFYTLAVGDTTLRDWFADILDGTMTHVAP